MLDRVLHEWLQQEAGHQRLAGPFAGGDAHLQAIAKTRPLDLDIAIEQRQLAIQRHAIDEPDIERLAQQMAQVADHALGRFGPLVDQLGDGVERVEQEVRLELHAQHLESRPGE